MKTTKIYLCALLFLFIGVCKVEAQTPRFPRFKVLAFCNNHVEPDHVEFEKDAIKFFKDLTKGDGFVFDTTSNFNDLNEEKLKDYQLVMMINDFPHSAQQRAAFEKYMENGGGWMGFHVSAYNDKDTNWPWFVNFLGGAVFYTNNWPPMPAKIVIDDQQSAVTKGLPKTFVAPVNEWYQWKPSPRDNKDVKVFASLSTENYPFGLKDIIQGGDTPVVWTNTNYRMIYLNMGHANQIFTDATQNMLIINSLKWVIATDKKGNAFER